jgi:hypothetical protein
MMGRQRDRGGIRFSCVWISVDQDLARCENIRCGWASEEWRSAHWLAAGRQNELRSRVGHVCGRE